jgi:molybdopterin/thiamine biosynthesis adenylyltransferase/rhodanese-related sulfurtransferase
MTSEITPRDASYRLSRGTLLVDVREEHERELGMAQGALGVARAELEAEPHRYLPGQDAEIMLICQTGGRSMLAAEQLQRLGYRRVHSVRGGTLMWQAEGLPLRHPAGSVDEDFRERYSRHLRLPEIGARGQRMLEAANVVVVGAGGLGSPAAFYLAAAGVGQLRLIDDDVVDRSNLQRQILHTEADIGVAKVESAQTRLSALNPRIAIEPVVERLDSDNVERLIGEADVVLDGGDNFPVRYLLNDACVHLGKPLVYGAVHRFEGQVSVFDAGRERGRLPCYRCLFPEPPPPEAAPNCSEVGVLGVLPGVVGMLQATEALKLLLHVGQPLAGRLLHFDALSMRFRETRLSADPDCPLCAPDKAFPGYIDYAAFCAG